jgi:hypothetical protein
MSGTSRSFWNAYNQQQLDIAASCMPKTAASGVLAQSNVSKRRVANSKPSKPNSAAEVRDFYRSISLDLLQADMLAQDHFEGHFLA